jgi:hypothetical protein
MWLARVFGGLVVLALGIVVIFFSRQLPYHSDYGPGPGFLPTWIGYVLVACAVVVTAQELRTANHNETFFQPKTRMAVNRDHFSPFPGIGFLRRFWPLHLRRDAVDGRASLGHVRGCRDRDSGEHSFSIR